MHMLKLTQIGNSVGVILAKESLSRLKLAKGESVSLEPVHDLFMVPARQQKAAIKARAAGHAGGLDKVRNAECGFLLPCPKGCHAKGTMKRPSTGS